MSPEDVRRMVREELAAILRPLVGQPSTDRALSTRPGEEPTEYAGRRRAWLRAVRSIPGARKVGRQWFVGGDAYASWLASKAAPVSVEPCEPRKAWTPTIAPGLRRVG